MPKKLTTGWHKKGDIESRATIGVFEAGDVIFGINGFKYRKETDEYFVTKRGLRSLCPPPRPAYSTA